MKEPSEESLESMASGDLKPLMRRRTRSFHQVTPEGRMMRKGRERRTRKKGEKGWGQLGEDAYP